MSTIRGCSFMSPVLSLLDDEALGRLGEKQPFDEPPLQEVLLHELGYVFLRDVGVVEAFRIDDEDDPLPCHTQAPGLEDRNFP